MSTEIAYMVSVRLMTYNHEKFIRDALDSIFNQVIDFNVEVVVGDDYSTDKTIEIVKSYKNTERIHLKILDRTLGDDYWEKRNKLGRLINFVDILNNCSGKYIALLDGDDYWVDQYKLKKQVDILEKSKDYSGCFHDTYKVNETGDKEVFNNLDLYKVDPEDTLSTRSLFHTSSFMFKKECLDLPAWFLDIQSADMALFSIISKYGSLIRIPEIMSHYRQNPDGVSKSEFHQKNWILSRIELMTYLYKYHEYKYREKYVETISYYLRLYQMVNASKEPNQNKKNNKEGLLKNLIKKLSL